MQNKIYMVRLAIYYQCWEKDCIRFEDIIMGLPERFLAKVRHQFCNQHIKGHFGRYSIGFLCNLQMLHERQWDCVFNSACDTLHDKLLGAQRCLTWWDLFKEYWRLKSTLGCENTQYAHIFWNHLGHQIF